jgi:hypothetical protein
MVLIMVIEALRVVVHQADVGVSLVIIIIVINDWDSLGLLRSLNLPILLRTGWLLRGRTGILAIVLITRLFGVVFLVIILEVVLFFFVLIVVFGLGTLCLLLWR